jgi:hypothetical protein
MWFSTVRTLISSSAAISLLLKPRETATATRFSASVSVSSCSFSEASSGAPELTSRAIWVKFRRLRSPGNVLPYSQR